VTDLLAGKVAVVYGGGGAIGIPVMEMLEQHGRANTSLGRLPKLAEVAETAAFIASDRAGAMTGAIVNLACGSMTD
jgi:3-oxoacyl-[acyl-carrier protein] reductase